MTRIYLLLALSLSTCLLAHRANSQAITPLRPLVVTLDSGTTVRRQLIGIVPAAYQSLRLERELASQQLLVRQQRLEALTAIMRHDSAATVATATELQRVRQDYQRQGLELAAQQARTRKALALPVQKPFLLDPHTYAGVGAGLVAALLYSLFHQ